MKSPGHHVVRLVALAGLLLPARGALRAQQQGATELIALVSGLTITPRVMVIGMHPDDEDSQLLAWLARGRHVQTAYLSVTRGESAGNFLGAASGTTLGAARTQESLAARRIDGAEQFFTRMYDFGYAPNDSALFAAWNRDSLLGDIVTAIRSFRPHVIIADTPLDTADHDTQHRALAALVRDAFAAADDGNRFHPLDFGDAWSPAKLYQRGAGLVLDASEYDASLGATYADIARQARAQYRTQGLLDLTAPRSPFVVLQRLSPPVDSSPGLPREQSLFDGVDTTMARLAANVPAQLAELLGRLGAAGDSARRGMDAANPAESVDALARWSALLTAARRATPACRHPVPVVPLASPRAFTCDQSLLDLDASLDLMLARANAALLVAAGVTIDATTDRELVAAGDSAPVTIRIANHGATPVRVVRLSVWGDVDTTSGARDIAPGSSASIVRRITGLSQRYQWWMGPRAANRYTVPVSSMDGVTREPRPRTDTLRLDPAAMSANGVITMMMASGVALPEQMRRASDVTVALEIAGDTVTASAGAVRFRYADAVVGLQERPIAGVPDVTLNLNRALAFVPVGQRLDRGVHVNITSYSSKPQRLALRVVSPPGVRDSLIPNAFNLGPREQREVVVQLRGAMEPGDKQAFGVVGSVGGGPPFALGFRTTQYPELLPIRVSWQSGMWLQPVRITVPRTLTVVYVAGVSDDVPLALQDVGVSVANIAPADLLAVDLKRVTTLVFGPRAFEAHPELLLQMPRFMRWARGGGTIVVQRGGPATLRSGALPHFVDFGNPFTRRIADPAAPVSRVTPAPSLLQWPNIITPDDWMGWVGERAPFAPTQVDPAYEHVIEVHDADGTPNRNTLLVARVGKGRFIYSALTLDEQIAAGVPGALRLLVNLLSAGIVPPGAAP